MMAYDPCSSPSLCPPIEIGCTDEAKKEISRIYAEIEKTPAEDKYKPISDRKLQHVVKIAGIRALLRDGISTREFGEIKQKHEQTEEGKAAINAEKAAAEEKEKTAINLTKSKNRLLELLKSKKPDADESAPDTTEETAHEGGEEDAETAAARQEADEAKAKHTEALKAWEDTKAKLNDVVTIHIIRDKLKLIREIQIGKTDVEWAENLLNLCEVEAKRLVLNDIVDGGFMEIEELVRARLKKSKNGILPLSVLQKDISSLRKLDAQGKSKQFWEYMESEGFLRVKTNRGTSWALGALEMADLQHPQS